MEHEILIFDKENYANGIIFIDYDIGVTVFIEGRKDPVACLIGRSSPLCKKEITNKVYRKMYYHYSWCIKRGYLSLIESRNFFQENSEYIAGSYPFIEKCPFNQ